VENVENAAAQCLRSTQGWAVPCTLDHKGRFYLVPAWHGILQHQLLLPECAGASLGDGTLCNATSANCLNTLLGKGFVLGAAYYRYSTLQAAQLKGYRQHNPLCTGCSPGFYKQFNGSCTQCYSRQQFWTRMGLIICIIIGIMALEQFTRSLRHRWSARGTSPGTAAKLRVVCTALQVVVHASTALGTPYPMPVQLVLESLRVPLSLGMLNVFPFECNGIVSPGLRKGRWSFASAAFSQEVITNGLAMGFIFGYVIGSVDQSSQTRGRYLLLGMFLTAFAFWSRQGMSGDVEDFFFLPFFGWLLFSEDSWVCRWVFEPLGALVTIPHAWDILFLLHAPMSARVFRTLVCRQFDDGAELAPITRYATPCLGISNTATALGLSVWPIGVPLLYFALLWSHRGDIQDAHWRKHGRAFQTSPPRLKRNNTQCSWFLGLRNRLRALHGALEALITAEYCFAHRQHSARMLETRLGWCESAAAAPGVGSSDQGEAVAGGVAASDAVVLSSTPTVVSTAASTAIRGAVVAACAAATAAAKASAAAAVATAIIFDCGGGIIVQRNPGTWRVIGPQRAAEVCGAARNKLPLQLAADKEARKRCSADLLQQESENNLLVRCGSKLVGAALRRISMWRSPEWALEHWVQGSMPIVLVPVVTLCSVFLRLCRFIFVTLPAFAFLLVSFYVPGMLLGPVYWCAVLGPLFIDDARERTRRWHWSTRPVGLLAHAILVMVLFPVVLMAPVTHRARESTSKFPTRHLGRLFEAYKPKYWCYELVMVAYRVFMVGILAIIGPGTGLQATLALCAEISCIALLLFIAPHAEQSCNTLALVAHTSVLLWILLSVIVTDEAKRAKESALSAAYFALLFGMPIYALFSICKREREHAAAVIARAKRCCVQLGVYSVALGKLVDIGSGTLLDKGRVLTAAHVVIDRNHRPPHPTWTDRGCTVLVAVYDGEDEQPPRWAYEAKVITPNDVLNQELDGNLTDLALLQITGSVSCKPERSHGKAHVCGTPGQPTPVGIVIALRSPYRTRLPSLSVARDLSSVHTGDHITVIGYAAAAGKHIFTDGGYIVEQAQGYLKTRAYIHSGLSGGAMLDASGRIIGVVSHGGGILLDRFGRMVNRIGEASDVPELAHARMVTKLTLQHAGASSGDEGSESEDESKSSAVITPSPLHPHDHSYLAVV
jgi:hypothetical protein